MNKGRRRGLGYMEEGVRFAVMLLLAGFGCSSGGETARNGATTSASVDAGTATGARTATDGGTSTRTGSPVNDASTSPDGGLSCNMQAIPAAELCKQVASGTITACSFGAGGEPSPTGYLEILAPDGSKTYVCATAWTDGGSGGYFFGTSSQFMSDPQSCCGGPASPVAAPGVPQPAFANLSTLQSPKDVKPQEMAAPGMGPLRENPFAVVVSDPSGAAAFYAAQTMWMSWAGDGKPHPGADGTGAYYFSAPLLVNYVIVETANAIPVVVLGPEVSLDANHSTPLGHPTLGACTTGGGAPVVLMAGELYGTTLDNHSGRFEHAVAVTPAVLDDAATLFNCLGIKVTETMYDAPK